MDKESVSCGDCGIVWTHCCPVCKAYPPNMVFFPTPKKIFFPASNELKGNMFATSRNEPTQRKARMGGGTGKPPKGNKKVDVTIQMLPVTMDNFFMSTYGVFDRLDEIPAGYEKIFESRGSAYYSDESKETLIRVSDHWGHSIKCCAWFIRGFEKKSSWRWQKQHGKEKFVGLIKIADLTPNFMYAENREYAKANGMEVPDWIVERSDRVNNRHPL